MGLCHLAAQQGPFARHPNWILEGQLWSFGKPFLPAGFVSLEFETSKVALNWKLPMLLLRVGTDQRRVVSHCLLKRLTRKASRKHGPKMTRQVLPARPIVKHSPPDSQTDRQTARQTGRQTASQPASSQPEARLTDRRTERQTKRQLDAPTQMHTHTDERHTNTDTITLTHKQGLYEQTETKPHSA